MDIFLLYSKGHTLQCITEQQLKYSDLKSGGVAGAQYHSDLYQV